MKLFALSTDCEDLANYSRLFGFDFPASVHGKCDARWPTGCSLRAGIPVLGVSGHTQLYMQYIVFCDVMGVGAGAGRID